MGHSGAKTNKGRGRQGLVRVGRGEHVLAAMANAHGTVTRSHVMAAIAVNWLRP